MTTELQRIVSDFNSKYNINIDQNTRILDLCSEVGEICKLGFKTKVAESFSSTEWQEELGDALYSMISLMIVLNVDAENSLHLTLRKYEERILKKGFISSSL